VAALNHPNIVVLYSVEDAGTVRFVTMERARRLVPEVSLAMVRRVLGAMAPDVDRRMMGALQQAGLY
jgi:hypothetical protein